MSITGLPGKIYLFIHHAVYNRRLKRQKHFPQLYIVSVGNLSAGGTGKTPAVIYLAEAVKDKSPLIVLRGYGGKGSMAGTLVSSGNDILSNYYEAGDEALLIARKTGMSVAAGKDRASLIEKYAKSGSVVILDDAFQNPTVARNHDLVLIDATVSPEDVLVFPMGRFRESWDALKRAGSVLLTRTDQVDEKRLATLESIIKKYVPETRIFRSVHKAVPLSEEIGASIAAFSGIGNPSAFYRTLKQSGVDLRDTIDFPDHHPFTEKDVKRIFQGNDYHWITTEKDLVRLMELEIPQDWKNRLHTLEIKLEICQGRETEFIEKVFAGFQL